jgi:hypothetical protein
MVKEAILNREIDNNYDSAYDFILRKAKEMGVSKSNRN